MTRCNDLSEQMGVGPLDDDRNDPRDHDERRIALTDAFIEQANLAYDARLHARDEPHDTYCGWCDAHETAGESHRDDCPLRASPCRGCGSIHCDSECAEFRAWLTVAFLDWDAAQANEVG